MNNNDFFNKEYLLSDQYVDHMMIESNMDYEDFINFHHDAEPKTKNYNIRHFQLTKALGGWRWKGVFTYRETFVDLIFNENLKGIDFGGSQRPISFDIDVVDIEKEDFYGREVKYHSIDEVDFDLDYIFSSHTFEHIPELDKILAKLYDKLQPDGILALNLPSYTCKRWWADTGNWMGGTPHVHTFKLSKSSTTDNIPNLVDIDTKLEEVGFNIALAEYAGDNNIIIFAEK